MEKQKFSAAFVLAMAALSSTQSHAAESFAVRYNVVGSVGGEIFAPVNLSGWIGAGVFSAANIHEITGVDGHALGASLPGGEVPLPSPTPTALYPTYGATPVTVGYTAHEKALNVAIAYLTKEKFAGGQLLFSFTIPQGEKNQTTTVSGATPTLTYNPLIPPATQSVVNQQFDAYYQAQLKLAGTASTNRSTGIGDAQIGIGWRMATASYKLIGTLTLAVPTGDYSPGPGGDIGFGKFYTLKPEINGVYFVTDDLAVSGKVGLGLNTTNHENHWRSGNWAGGEFAIGYKTPVGVVGLHTVHLQQMQDDVNSGYGSNRLRSDNAGVFFTTLIPGINAGLNVQYMKTVDSRYSIAADYFQARVTKVF